MEVLLLDSYRDVLLKVRDLVYDRHILLTHPQASSLKPNQDAISVHHGISERGRGQYERYHADRKMH